MLDTKKIKKDFPIFNNLPDLVYLDSTATSLKPQSVINKLVEYYQKYSANIYRGIYKISEKATSEYEKTREIVAQFIGGKTNEVVFTRNTTESLNLIAYSLGREIVDKGDEVVVTIMEHHSNFVPWQVLAYEKGATFKVVDIDENGLLDMVFEKAVTRKTKILALTYVSNVLGTINPVKDIIKAAKRINPNIITIVDAAQAIPHLKIDANDLGCDFLVASSHKMLGPTGVGILWGRHDLLETMFPFQYGGEMVQEVTIKKTTYKESPHKFEAGTPDIGGIIALKEGISYLKNLGFENIRAHERELIKYAFLKINQEFGDKIKILGPSDLEKHSGIISFVFNKYHPHDIAQILDEDNICIRAGHHCAMPLHRRLGLSASARASFYIYNDKEDVDSLIKGLKKVEAVLQ